jgi:hypothetical protein
LIEWWLDACQSVKILIFYKRFSKNWPSESKISFKNSLWSWGNLKNKETCENFSKTTTSEV